MPYIRKRSREKTEQNKTSKSRGNGKSRGVQLGPETTFNQVGKHPIWRKAKKKKGRGEPRGHPHPDPNEAQKKKKNTKKTLRKKGLEDRPFTEEKKTKGGFPEFRQPTEGRKRRGGGKNPTSLWKVVKPTLGKTAEGNIPVALPR